ncbi:MAG: serine/threonine-protein kinase, partial [Planctomycetota bacterium]|nr:serine/threonine-protein kinase [Planctomycetota bacterium]
MQLTEADHHLARVMLEQRLVDQNGLRHLAYQAQQEGLSFQQIVQRSGLWPQQKNATPTNDHMGTQVDAPTPAPTKNVVFGTQFGAPSQIAPVSQPPLQNSAASSGPYNLATVQELPSSQLLAASSKHSLDAVQPSLENSYSSDTADNVLTVNQSQLDSHGIENSMADTHGAQHIQAKELKSLGPYEVIGELGRGAMGVVYKARHTGLDRICALKVLISGEDASVNSLNRFVAEAKTAASLDDHPHIVKVLDSGQVDRMYYMAMELVEGLSLQKLIDADKVKPKAGARVLADIADALAYAHEKGVIHRDIKPDNILIDLNSTPKLNDFGVAKAAEESGQTMTGVVMGTLAFMAPEQAEDSKNVDAR